VHQITVNLANETVKLNTRKNSVCPSKAWQILLERWENAK